MSLMRTLKIEGITPDAHNALVEAGAIHIHSGFERWCLSGGQTCACNSHSRGQDWDLYEIPAERCKLNYYSSPFVRPRVLQDEHDIRGEHDGDETFFHHVISFADGRTLERRQHSHWAAETVLINAGYPTGAQLARMGRNAPMSWPVE